jgi:flagellar motor protein MotB
MPRPNEGEPAVSRTKKVSQEDEPNIWPVVADVFIGFLVLILVAVLASYVELTRKAGAGTRNPPAAMAKAEEKIRNNLAGIAKVKREGFAELRVCFPANFLFDKCETELKDTKLIDRLKKSLRESNSKSEIERVVVTGHTDSDPPSSDPNKRCSAQGIKTNWQLSARRAIEVVEHLMPSNPQDQDGIDPVKVKVWATARSSYDRANCDLSRETDPEKLKERDRRIEVWIKFKEN